MSQFSSLRIRPRHIGFRTTLSGIFSGSLCLHSFLDIHGLFAKYCSRQSSI